MLRNFCFLYFFLIHINSYLTLLYFRPFPPLLLRCFVSSGMFCIRHTTMMTYIHP